MPKWPGHEYRANFIFAALSALVTGGKTAMAKVLDALWMLLQELVVVFGFLSVLFKLCKPLVEIAWELILQLWISQQRQRRNQHERRRLMSQLSKLQRDIESYQSLVQQRMEHKSSSNVYAKSYDESRKDLPNRAVIRDPETGDRAFTTDATQSNNCAEINEHDGAIEGHTSAFKHISRRWER
uniref:AlNc14C10G1267 protein n=1 Tax=Albugo laibachii Nc14 TaxID=890382 RepID=F0W2M0_9STRA|nr:AlNc14C10G1267 [Albugo laibachii Nc14]|eukprot:CCA15306.1 AlNc14C10G1267 [Albugo laibachii Nc14]